MMRPKSSDLALSLLLAGCGATAAGEDPSAVGTAQLAITSVPSGVACVRLDLSGSVTGAGSSPSRPAPAPC